MNSTFNRKRYQGKDRLYVSIPRTKGIFRLYVWDKDITAYSDPQSGKKYFARRNSPTFDGTIARQTMYFHTLDEAETWQGQGVNAQTAAMPRVIKEVLPETANAKAASDTGYTFWNLIEDFKKHKFPLLRRSTRLQYLKVIPMYEYLFSMDVEAINPAAIDAWINHLKSDEKISRYQKTRTSFDKEVESLKAILNWYIGRCDHTRLILPFKTRHKEMVQLKQKAQNTQKFMTPEECELWFQTLRRVAPEFVDPAITQVDELLRVSEVFAMKWDNYDKAKGVYRVCEHVVWDRTRNGEANIESGTKNLKAGEYYDVPLRHRVIELLEKLKPEAKCELIFHDDCKPWTYRQIQYGYNKAFKAAGLKYRSTHVCRHTGATRLLDETGDRLVVQQMGNWSSRDIADHYARVVLPGFQH